MVSRTPAHGSSTVSTRRGDAREVLRILFRHKWKMATVFTGTMILAVVAVLVLPRSYTSSANLFMRLGKESVGLDPTATVHRVLDVERSRDNEINSEVEILKSRVLLEDVVEKLGPDYILHTSDEQAGRLSSMVQAAASVVRGLLYGRITPTERAVEKLEELVIVIPPRKSNIIQVRASGRSPEQAQKILQCYMDAFVDRHVKANRTDGSYEFFVDQSQHLLAELEAATAELRDAKNSTTLVSIEGEKQNVQTQATSIESAILQNERALAHSDARIAALRKALKELPPELNAETARAPNASADAMRSQLYTLQIQEKDASARFTSLHPQVIALRRQVAETKKILDEQEEVRSTTTSRLSSVHLGAQTDLMAAEALAAAQRAEANSLKEQFDAVRSKIHTLNDNEIRITDLTRKTQLLDASYRTYVTNREQARIDQELATGRISNVNVVQPATLVAKPSNPRVPLILLGGLLLASVGAVCVAFAAEFLDPSLKTSEQVENELGIPVLFSVPRGTGHELLHN
jgi:polysaccharide biosynthesis protein PslE